MRKYHSIFLDVALQKFIYNDCPYVLFNLKKMSICTMISEKMTCNALFVSLYIWYIDYVTISKARGNTGENLFVL